MWCFLVDELSGMFPNKLEDVDQTNWNGTNLVTVLDFWPQDLFSLAAPSSVPGGFWVASQTVNRSWLSTTTTGPMATQAEVEKTRALSFFAKRHRSSWRTNSRQRLAFRNILVDDRPALHMCIYVYIWSYIDINIFKRRKPVGIGHSIGVIHSELSTSVAGRQSFCDWSGHRPSTTTHHLVWVDFMIGIVILFFCWYWWLIIILVDIDIRIIVLILCWYVVGHLVWQTDINQS